jgi:hypothetical protein
MSKIKDLITKIEERKRLADRSKTSRPSKLRSLPISKKELEFIIKQGLPK